MNSHSVAQAIERMEITCRRHGLPVTPQRRIVMDVLARSGAHPTAEDVLEASRLKEPGISRSTVYRILDTFVRLGVANRAFHPDAAVRFDATTDRHHHTVCVRCGVLSDWRDDSLADLDIPQESIGGLDVLGYSIYVHGICSKCRDLETNRVEDPKGAGK